MDVLRGFAVSGRNIADPRHGAKCPRSPRAVWHEMGFHEIGAVPGEILESPPGALELRLYVARRVTFFFAGSALHETHVPRPPMRLRASGPVAYFTAAESLTDWNSRFLRVPPGMR